jgi:hypothetical protein
MPIHYSVDLFQIEEQLDLLRRAGKKITFIIPVVVEHKPGSIFGKVISYAIVFEDAQTVEDQNL